jgi:thymidylate kinase
MIVELCGIPGCGKSTAITLLGEKCPGLLEGKGTWRELYPRGKWKRRIYRGFHTLRLALGIRSSREKELMRALATTERGTFVYRARAVILFGLMMRARGQFVMDEGLVQQMSSAAYRQRLCLPKDMAPPGSDIEGGYVIIRFDCPVDECMNRNRKRGRSNRYNPDSDNELRKVLEVKRDNLNLLTDMMGCRVFDIDTTQPPERCAGELEEILRSVLEEASPHE